MSETRNCPRCGKPVAAGQDRCNACGAPLNGEPAKQAETVLPGLGKGGAFIHRDAAWKQLLAVALFAIVAFLDISGMMFYHRNYPIFIIIMLLAAAALFLTLGRISNRAVLMKKRASRHDADIGSALASGARNMVSRSLVTALKGILLAALVAAVLLLYNRPHMVFRRNATGYGLRFYTNAFHGVADVVIPETYRGRPVTDIRGSVFQGLSGIRSVRLPSGITQIRASTFEGCSRLESIDIPEGVTRIGNHAFCDCRSLSEVGIPSTLREIGSSAFRRCHRLEEVRVPEICSVNARAFRESPTKVERY